MEAMLPLVSCLEQADSKEFTLKEAIPMIQSAIVLVGDAAQHQSSLKRKESNEPTASDIDEGL